MKTRDKWQCSGVLALVSGSTTDDADVVQAPPGYCAFIDAVSLFVEGSDEGGEPIPLILDGVAFIEFYDSMINPLNDDTIWAATVGGPDTAGGLNRTNQTFHGVYAENLELANQCSLASNNRQYRRGSFSSPGGLLRIRGTSENGGALIFSVSGHFEKAQSYRRQFASFAPDTVSAAVAIVNGRWYALARMVNVASGFWTMPAGAASLSSSQRFAVDQAQVGAGTTLTPTTLNNLPLGFYVAGATSLGGIRRTSQFICGLSAPRHEILPVARRGRAGEPLIFGVETDILEAETASSVVLMNGFIEDGAIDDHYSQVGLP